MLRPSLTIFWGFRVKWYLEVRANYYEILENGWGNKVGLGEILRFLKKMGENGKGGPLGEMEDFVDF